VQQENNLNEHWRKHSFNARPNDIPTTPSNEGGLLNLAKADILSIQTILGGADVAAADHCFSTAKLATGDESHGPAARARHHGYKWVLGVTQLRLVFQDENRSRVHSFRYPFFKKLQVG
jgi:hypothetical protein